MMCGGSLQVVCNVAHFTDLPDFRETISVEIYLFFKKQRHINDVRWFNASSVQCSHISPLARKFGKQFSAKIGVI